MYNFDMPAFLLCFFHLHCATQVLNIKRDFKIGHYGPLGRLDAYTGSLAGAMTVKRHENFQFKIRSTKQRTVKNMSFDEVRQPRPQGSSLFPSLFPFPTHFLREKPWGRGWKCETRLKFLSQKAQLLKKTVSHFKRRIPIRRIRVQIKAS